MRYLVGHSMHESDNATFRELKAAAIPVYQGTPSSDRVRCKEVKTSVVGVVQFTNGQLLVVERCMDYFSVKYRTEIERSQAFRIEERSGKHIFWTVNSFRVNYQEGLNMLIRIFEAECGPALLEVDLRAAASMCFYGLTDLRRL